MALLTRLRRLALALPEAVERRTWDCATFRIRDKIFAMHVAAGDGEAVWCKAPPGVQAMLVEAAPDRFFVPPYFGRNGWIGVRLLATTDHAATDWAELADLIARSWRMTAPRRLALSPAADERAAKVPAKARPTARRSAALPRPREAGQHHPPSRPSTR